MNISNLQVRQVIKNYKELCFILEIKATTGCSKIKQLEDLKIYCYYHKQGNKFVIDEVFEKPIITIDNIINNNNKYTKILANIILEYLYTQPKELKEVPISKLFTLLGITNSNYNSANYYRKELSQLYDVRLASIYYFYSNTRMQFKGIIERCLNNLQNRRVLNWYKVVMIIDKTTKQIYKADKETEKFIIDTEKETLEYLEVNNMYELMKDKKKVKEFNDIIFKETNINYFYAYDLVIGEKAIQIEYNKVKNNKQHLNELIIKKNELTFNKDKYITYIDDYNLLNDILININNTSDIKEELKQKHEDNIMNYYLDTNKSDNKLTDAFIKHESELKDIKDKYLDTYSL